MSEFGFKKPIRGAHWFIITWLTLGVSLSVWWLIFALRKIDDLKAEASEALEGLVREQQMLVQEGIFLVILFLVGGAAISWLLIRESKRNLQLKHFFTSFTHDIKTTLARINLQLESLNQSEASESLLHNTSQLQLQMDNALNLYSDDFSTHREKVELKNIIRSFHQLWPSIEISLSGNAELVGDRNAFDSIFRNLLHNADAHGRATEVKMVVKESPKSSMVELYIEDNGIGFSGDISTLGERPQGKSTKGFSHSGLGLCIVRRWVERLSGRIDFSSQVDNGFLVRMTLPGNFLGGEV